MRKMIIGFVLLLILVSTTVFIKQHHRLNKDQVAKEPMQNPSTSLNSSSSISSKTFTSTKLKKAKEKAKEEKFSQEELEEALDFLSELSEEEEKGGEAPESKQPEGEYQSESQEERSKSYLPIYGGAKIPDIPETRALLARDRQLATHSRKLLKKKKELHEWNTLLVKKYQRGEISPEQFRKEYKEWDVQIDRAEREQNAIHLERKRILKELLSYRED